MYLLFVTEWFLYQSKRNKKPEIRILPSRHMTSFQRLCDVYTTSATSIIGLNIMIIMVISFIKIIPIINISFTVSISAMRLAEKNTYSTLQLGYCTTK